MKLTITKANHGHLDACASILGDTELGQRYFVDREDRYIGRELLKEGFDKGEISVALLEDGSCAGFVWIELNGIFHWFPFCHVVAVRADLRGRGVGTALMDRFHEVAFEEDRSPKAFLEVGDFNPSAIALYEKLGYQRVGVVQDLYIRGVGEILMVKDAPRQA